MPYVDGDIGFPFMAPTSIETGGAVEATTALTAVTSGAGNVFGSIVQLIASTAKEAVGIIVCCTLYMPAAASRTRVAICVGGAGSETELVSFTTACKGNYASVNNPVYQAFLIRVPAATRVSAKVASDTASQVADISVYLMERN